MPSYRSLDGMTIAIQDNVAVPMGPDGSPVLLHAGDGQCYARQPDGGWVQLIENAMGLKQRVSKSVPKGMQQSLEKGYSARIDATRKNLGAALVGTQRMED